MIDEIEFVRLVGAKDNEVLGPSRRATISFPQTALVGFCAQYQSAVSGVQKGLCDCFSTPARLP